MHVSIIYLLYNLYGISFDFWIIGIDPIIKSRVWDIIEDAKKGCTIVLISHSMEEAELLGDRIGIMIKVDSN